MYQNIEIYEQPSLYFDRNGMKRHENTEIHDPVMVFLSKYNISIVSASDNSFASYDEKHNNFLPLQHLDQLIDTITYPFPLIGKTCQFYKEKLYVNPTIFLGRIIKKDAILPVHRYFTNTEFEGPAPIACWLFNHTSNTLSGIIFSKSFSEQNAD